MASFFYDGIYLHCIFPPKSISPIQILVMSLELLTRLNCQVMNSLNVKGKSMKTLNIIKTNTFLQ